MFKIRIENVPVVKYVFKTHSFEYELNPALLD